MRIGDGQLRNCDFTDRGVLVVEAIYLKEAKVKR